MCPGTGLVTGCHHQQCGAVLDSVRKVPDTFERCIVGPVRILDQHQHRLSPGKLLDHGEQGVEQHAAVRNLGIAR